VMMARALCRLSAWILLLLRRGLRHDHAGRKQCSEKQACCTCESSWHKVLFSLAPGSAWPEPACRDRPGSEEGVAPPAYCPTLGARV
jgi:hypothetical protein